MGGGETTSFTANQNLFYFIGNVNPENEQAMNTSNDYDFVKHVLEFINKTELVIGSYITNETAIYIYDKNSSSATKKILIPKRTSSVHMSTHSDWGDFMPAKIVLLVVLVSFMVWFVHCVCKVYERAINCPPTPEALHMPMLSAKPPLAIIPDIISDICIESLLNRQY